MNQDSILSKKQLPQPKTRKEIVNSINSVVQRLKLLIKLQINSDTIQEQLQCMAQVNATLIEHLVSAFKFIREDKGAVNQKLIESEINYCDRTIKLFQMKLIDTVESIMRHESERREEDDTQEIYKQFYILCSDYMNESYEQSNKICILLSQEVHAQSPNHKSVPNFPNGNEKKPTHSADYFLLKHLLEKVSNAKRIYEQETLIRQRELESICKQIQDKKNQIANLINSREELVEDLSQLQEALEKGQLKQAREILNKRMPHRQQSQITLKDKIQDFRSNLKTIKEQNGSKLQKQIEELRRENDSLRNELQELKKKLQKYKEEVYRAAWIISVQNREINLNEERIKELQTKYEDSKITFNGTRNSNQIPVKTKLKFSPRLPSTDAIFANLHV